MIRASAPGYTFEVIYNDEDSVTFLAEERRFSEWLAHIEALLGPGQVRYQGKGTPREADLYDVDGEGDDSEAIHVTHVSRSVSGDLPGDPAAISPDVTARTP